jgi:hypothetical protein
MLCPECLEDATAWCEAPHPYCKRCFIDNGGCPTCAKIEIPRLAKGDFSINSQEDENVIILDRLTRISQLQSDFDVIERQLSKSRKKHPVFTWPLFTENNPGCTIVECSVPPIRRFSRAVWGTVVNDDLVIDDSLRPSEKFTLIKSAASHELTKTVKPFYMTRQTKNSFTSNGFRIITDPILCIAHVFPLTDFMIRGHVLGILIDFDFDGFCIRVEPFTGNHYRIIDVGKSHLVDFTIDAEHSISHVAEIIDNDLILVCNNGKVLRVQGIANPIAQRGTELSIAKKQLEYRAEELEFAEQFSLPSTALDLTFVDKTINKSLDLTKGNWDSTFSRETVRGQLFVSRAEGEFDFHMFLILPDGATEEHKYRCFDIDDAGSPFRTTLLGQELEFDVDHIRIIDGHTFSKNLAGDLVRD